MKSSMHLAQVNIARMKGPQRGAESTAQALRVTLLVKVASEAAGVDSALEKLRVQRPATRVARRRR
jgi:hypothetical protein